MIRSRSWWLALFPLRSNHPSLIKAKPRSTFRSYVESLEDRIAPALITIDTTAMTISNSSSVAENQHVYNGVSYTAHWTDNGQVAEFAFSGNFTVSADDVLSVTGLDGRAIRVVVGGDVNLLGSLEVSTSTSVIFQVSGAADFAGVVDLSGTFSVSAERLDVSGAITAATVMLESQELLNVAPGASVVAADGGTLHIGGSTVINSGELLADGVNGGRVEVSATNIQNSGTMSADGSQGTGGGVAVTFTGTYIETSSGLLSADGTLGAGGTVTVEGGSGYLFTSGRQEARGPAGGEVHLRAGRINAVSATEDVSGTAGAGGNIIIYALLDGDYSGALFSRGVTSGGFIEVSAAGTLTYSGTADAGATDGEAGTLLLDPKNLIISTSSGALPQFTFVDPNPNTGGRFGDYVLPLSTGSVLITDPTDNLNGSNSGAVYLFNGRTGALISSLVGSAANDKIGQVDGTNSNGVLALSNGDFVVASSFWGGGKGAVTWGSGTTGVSGGVSASNSLVGSRTTDAIGFSSAPNVYYSAVGMGVVALADGGYVVASTNWNSNRGAVTWGGRTGITGVVSETNSLVGTNVDDRVGGMGVTALSNGNYVVASTDWNGGRGAVTWGSGTSGVKGPLTSANSLTGTSVTDHVGRSYGSTGGDYYGNGIFALSNGDFFVKSPNWSDGRGAATWVSGTSGVAGNVSSANSLVGVSAGDNVGGRDFYDTIFELGNGNYVVASSNWNNGAGAVTFGRSGSGIAGTINSSNSLIGTNAGDSVGNYGIRELANGNFVIRSTSWSSNRGAVTWSSGVSGIVGIVSATNSLVGANANDRIGNQFYGGLTALSNGHYVVASENWNGNRGAVTWGNGTTGVTGVVSSSNSLVGTSANDYVGYYGTTDLGNGNYVVVSPFWNGNRGAATWVNGNAAISGTVSAANSLVGGFANDFIEGVTVLSNGNYVVRTPRWNGYKGAATFANGMTGITGTISASNSLVGSTGGPGNGATPGDQVGYEVVPLTNGNYVVSSESWTNWQGAVTWGSGTTGVKGVVSSSNSLTGSSSFSRGLNVRALESGNYLVTGLGWNSFRGAVTWGNGSTGVSGAVSASNSLVGSASNQNVGFYLHVLSNGNYLVIDHTWNGAKGAVTWGSGTRGVIGQVSASNSFVGTTAGDQIGNANLFYVNEIGSGYLITSQNWNVSRGAVTWFNSDTGLPLDGANSVTPQNSIVGIAQAAGLAYTPSHDAVNGTFIAAFTTQGSGRVTAGFIDPNQLTFSQAAISDIHVTPSFLTRTLNTGTSVVLQADNDISIKSPIVVNNPNGNGGSLTLDAGRSILFDANSGITTDNGDLTLIANDPTAIQANRNSGTANITIPGTSVLNVGTGTLTIIMNPGATAGTAGTVSIGANPIAGATVYSTTTSLQDIGPTTSIAGQSVSFKATVTAAAGAALNGVTVDIIDVTSGGTIVATPTLVNGVANFTVASLAAGTHELRAVFVGDTGHLASQSGTVTQIVNPDTVLTSPASITVNVGAIASFTTLSALSAIDVVNWQVSTDSGQTWQPSNSSGLPDTFANSATGTTLSFTTNATQSGYQYRAVFTNPAYSSNNPLISEAATLTAWDTITLHPADQAALPGQSAVFTAASGFADDSVRWQVSTDLGASWADVPGATSTTLTLTNITASQDGNEYRAVFTPPDGTPTDPTRTAILNGQTVLISNPAFLTFDGIVQQPSDQNYAQTVTFSASSVRSSDTVQWMVSTDGGQHFQPVADMGPYSGSQTPSLTITGTTTDMLGNLYRAVFSNPKLTLTTNSATLVPAALWDADPTPNNVPQGAVAGQPIGLTVTTDLNNGVGLTYELSANAGGRFSINPTTGVVTVAAGAAINSLDQSYVIQIVARDTVGNTAISDFTISVTNTPPAAPVDQNLSPNSVPAHAVAGTPVGITAVALDPNPVTYSLTNSADGRFKIDAQTGVVTVANGSQINFPDTYTITVLATGVGGTSSSTFTLITNSSDSNALTIGGYSLLNPVITGTNITGTANLPLVGSVTLSGTVQSGQYQLSSATLSGVSLNGLAISSPVFNLTNSGLTLGGSFSNLPVLGTVQVLGTISSPTDFKLAVQAPLPTIGGFSLTAASIAPSVSGFGLTANVNLPGLGAVSLSGTVQDGTHYSLTAKLPSMTLNSTLLANATVTLSASGVSVSGTASLPLIGTVALTGTLQNGQYSLTANVPQISVAGFTVTGGVVTLSSSGISFTGSAKLPLVNNGNSLTLSGSIQDGTHYSFSANVPDLSLNGFTLKSAVVALGPTGVTLSATANLPLVNSVNLSGSITAAGNYSFSANIPNLPPIAGFQLTGVKVTLTNSGLGLTGTASLPIFGNVTLNGLITDATHYSVSFTPATVDLGGGFSLTSPRVNLSPAGLSVVGDANLPVLGTINRLQGTIQDATHFTLSAPLPNVSLGQFSLKNATVSLTAAGASTSLSVTGTVHLPLFKDVQFTGTIDSSGNLSLSTQLPSFSLPGGFIKFTNNSLTLYPDRVHVEADLSIANVADAHFVGDIYPNGDYELAASASLHIGGFTIPVPSVNGRPNLRLVNGQLDIGFDYSIPGLDAFLPAGDSSVEFSGTYSLDGQYSLTATANYTFTIGPVVVTQESLTLTNTSLTIAAHGSIANLGPLAEGDVSMTIYQDGSFQAMVMVNSSIAGIDLGNAEVTFGNHNPDKTLITTLHAEMSVPGMAPKVKVDGYWDANGNYEFTGSADVSLGSFTLAQAQFELSKQNGLTFSGEVNFGVMVATISGSITQDSSGGFTSTTDVTGTILNGPNLKLHGTFDSHGNYNFKGFANVVFGPLTLSQAEFELSNTNGLTFKSGWNFGVFQSTVSGTIQSEAGGFVITTDATGTVFGQSLNMHGEVHSNGRFDLTGDANVNLPLFQRSAQFELTNKTGATVFMFTTGLSYGPFAAATATGKIVGTNQSYDVTIDATGSVFGQSLTLHGDIHSTGKFALSGTANIGLQPLLGTSATFELSNFTGANVFKFTGQWNIGPFAASKMTGTIVGTSQFYTVTVDAEGKVFGQTLKLHGDIGSNGKFNLSGDAKVGLAPLLGTTANFSLSNNTGATVFKFTGAWKFTAFTSSLTATINTDQFGYSVTVDAVGSIFGQGLTLHGNIEDNGLFDLSGSAKVGLAPLAGTTATFGLSNYTGKTVFKFTGSWTIGAFASSGLTGTIIATANSFNVSVSATGTLLNNTVNLGGTIYSNGTFNLYARNNLRLFGVSLTSVLITLRSDKGFDVQASWSYPLFSGNLGGSIGTDGRVQLRGNGNAGLAGFSLNVGANIDLDPAHNRFSAGLSSRLNVYVATVSFTANANWSDGNLPGMEFTGRAAIGGELSKLLSGSADFTIGTNRIRFDGNLSIPYVGTSLEVHASVKGNGDLTGIPNLPNILSPGDLLKLAAEVWFELGATFTDAAKGLNKVFGKADDEVANLLKDAGALAGDLQDALGGAFNWSPSQISGYLSSAGGAVSSGVESFGGYVTGKKKISLGVPGGSLVFFDADFDEVLDPEEAWGYTTAEGEITFKIPVVFDVNGNGTLEDAEGQWIVQGGIDLTTGQVPAMNMIAPASWSVTSPLTTLVSKLIDSYGLTPSQAIAQVTLAFNVPAGVDLKTFDPVTAALASNPNGRTLENAHAKVENTVALIAALFRSPYNTLPSASLTNQVVEALVKFVSTASGPVDLTDTSTITTLIHSVETSTGISLNSNLIAGAATVISSCNQQFAAIGPTTGLTYLEDVAQIKKVVQTIVADDVASTAAGQMTVSALTAKDTGSTLAAAIAAALISPQLQVPINIFAPATSPAGANVNFTLAAFDLAGQALTPTSNFATGAQFPIGVTTVTVSATDALGNSISTTFTVTVADTTAPEIVLPADLTIEANAAGGANVTLPQATATDSVDPHPVLTYSQTSGFFELGTTTVTVTATDNLGNTSIRQFFVTVIDNTTPTLSLPTNLTIEANAAGGAFLDLPQATATDIADPNPLVTYDQSSGFFPLGTTIINATVVDAYGNTKTGSFSVMVIDTTAPTLVLPPDFVVEANTIGGANVTLPDVLGFDDADESLTMVVDHESGFFEFGTTTVHVTVTDAAGNHSSGSYTITVEDTTAPTLTLPANLEIQATITGGAIVNLPPVTVDDAADADPSVTVDHPSGFFPLGTTVVNVTTIDAAGNRSSGSYTVTVINTEAPSFVPAGSSQGLQAMGPFTTTQSDSDPLAGFKITVEAGTRGGAIVILPTLEATSAVDDAPLVRLDHASGFFPVGTTVVTAKATDSSGNVTTGTFTVTVVDTMAPLLTVPLNITVEANLSGGAAQVTLPAATASDLADPTPSIIYSKPSGIFPKGTTTVQVTAQDASGNTSLASFTVTVVDTTPPSVTAPGDMNVQATSVNGAQVTLPQLTVTDLVDSHPSVTFDHPSGLFAIGTTLVTARVTDAAGNTTPATFNVTVNPLSTSVTLQANSPNTSTYGDALNFTVFVSAGAGVTIPDGELVYLVDASHQNAVVGSGIIGNGSANVTVTRLNAGAHNLVAVYQGNLSNAGSESTGLSQTVSPRALTIKALASTKGYDGTPGSSTLPVVIGLQSGDTIAGLGQHYLDSSIGFNKTLVPSGSVEDGNAGNNYVLSFVNNVTGVITISLNGPSSASNNVQPTFTGTASTAAGDSTTVTVNIYSGPLATGQPLLSLPATVNGGSYSVQTIPAFAVEGTYTAQAVQITGSGPSYLSVPVTFQVDTTAPVLTLPPAQTLTAVQNAGVTDNLAFTATATDQVTSTPTITYKVGANIITPDYVFPVGQTTVTVTATDAAGNHSSGTFSVVVTKSTANEVTAKSGENTTLTATPPNGAAIQWQVSSDGIHFTNIAGANSASFQFIADLDQNGDTYRALFNRAAGVSSSVPTVLTVIQQPSILDAVFMLPENSAAGTTVGTATGTEPGETLTYSIIDGNSQSVFTIDPATGKITVASSTLLDFETHPTWPLVVQVTDRFGQFDTAVVTINLTNVNEAPTATSAQFSLLTGSSNNTVVGTVQASDPDSGDSVTYSISAGNSLGAFAINPQTGVITVADGSQLDAEIHPTFTLTIQATDSHGAMGTAVVTINLTGLNVIPVLSVNGGAANFSAKAARKSGPVRIAPEATVVDPDQSAATQLGGGRLVINITDFVRKVSKRGKVTNFDVVGGLSGASSLGTTRSTSVSDDNRLILAVDLNANTTAADVQKFLRGITFTTKGIGLKQTSRTLLAQVTDAAGAMSNVLQQRLNVSK